MAPPSEPLNRGGSGDPVTSSAYPRLATPGDIGRLTSGDRVSGAWPPPGTHVVPVGHPATWGLVVGDFDALEPDYWYVTTLDRFVADLPESAVSILARVSRDFVGPIALYAAVVGHWPVIFSPTEGLTVRWLQSTIRGTLRAVEEFQFGIAWGDPGNDPDLDEAGAMAFATDLAGLVNGWFITNGAGAFFSSSVALTEVGVTTKNITSATSSDGSGGNLSQSYPTQWAAYPLASQPRGSDPGVSLPYEVACAVTLQTDTRGPRGRGRVYLPPLSVSFMAADGVFSNGVITNMTNHFADFLNAVKTATGWKPLVVSKRALQLHEVTSIGVGHVPDSQRRRRRSQLEAPTTLAL
jgi:hypothetical protein